MHGKLSRERYLKGGFFVQELFVDHVREFQVEIDRIVDRETQDDPAKLEVQVALKRMLVKPEISIILSSLKTHGNKYRVLRL